ncbi:SIR2 family protein [Hwangdonia sp.]|uniref:SIR2 family protein n=1 Tax=Hwangdonia sp. TaxID=1883432 RepID=UPI003AB6697C
MHNQLKRILNQDDTVLFIGSGISLWSGLPTWYGLIEELSTFLEEIGIDKSLVDKELQKGELLQAASYGFDKLTPQLVGQFIRKTCRIGVSQPHQIHQLIVNLGPTCFVTTNYDNLLEQSFLKWKSQMHFRFITNRMLVETAEIVGARSNQFLYKLHGDAQDSSSIILTREQYRILNPDGELHHALDAIKTLQLSRPFVYIGFGLRDPDFLFVRDLIANTYKGGNRDHYCIVADITEAEVDYWRRNYGIHLLGYTTTINEDGSSNHGQLIDLLKSLGKPEELATSIANLKNDPGTLLKLTRHASRFLKNTNSISIIPLEVYPEKSKTNETKDYRYYGASIERILDHGPTRFILLGLPGSGKSFSIERSVFRLSEKLLDSCLSTPVDPSNLIVPIFIDLKNYQGNVIDLIEGSLPTGINFNDLCANFTVKIYFDAFNEIPVEYKEDNVWDTDINELLSSFPSISFIISSRTSDGLIDLDLPIYRIDSIEEKFVQENLSSKNILEPETVSREVLSILRRPIFYKLAIEGKFHITNHTKPSSIYSEYFKLLLSDIQGRFGQEINIFTPLEKLAAYAIDVGSETIDIDGVISSIKQICPEGLEYKDILNWLIAKEFFITSPNKKVSFFHQSITEFLAASDLAKEYQKDPAILERKMKNRNWDQALFLTLNLLPNPKSIEFLETVIKLDFELALVAVCYIDENQSSIVERLLEEIKTRSEEDFETMSSLEHKLDYSVPLTQEHIPTLIQIIESKNSLGGVAAAKVIELSAKHDKTFGINLIIENCTDYNFCSRIARQIRKKINQADLLELVNAAEIVQKQYDNKQIDNFEAFDSALGTLLHGQNAALVYDTFFDSNKTHEEQSVRIACLNDFLQDTRSQEGMNIAIKLLSQGVTDVVVPIYFILKFVDDDIELDLSVFSKEHIEELIEIVKNQHSKNADWALSSLKQLCEYSADNKTIVQKISQNEKGVVLAALNYCISEEDAFESLNNLIELDKEQLNLEPIDLIGHMELDWSNQGDLFIKLLRKRNIHLGWQLCESLDVISDNNKLPKLNFEDLSWWLEWIYEASSSKDDKSWIFVDRISILLSRVLKPLEVETLIREFNQPGSKYRKILQSNLLPRIDELKLEDFTPESISYLLDNIQLEASHYRGGLLQKISTDEFVISKLIPEYNKSNGQRKKYLNKIIEKIGKKHDKRYLIK